MTILNRANTPVPDACIVRQIKSNSRPHGEWSLDSALSSSHPRWHRKRVHAFVLSRIIATIRRPRSNAFWSPSPPVCLMVHDGDRATRLLHSYFIILHDEAIKMLSMAASHLRKPPTSLIKVASLGSKIAQRSVTPFPFVARAKEMTTVGASYVTLFLLCSSCNVANRSSEACGGRIGYLRLRPGRR